MEQEPSRFQKHENTKPVRFTDLAAPVVPLMKIDDKISVCEDDKVVIDQATRVDHYPLPRIRDLLASQLRSF